MSEAQLEANQWRGSVQPSGFPHICPYRQSGMEISDCIETSGRSIPLNQGACCGTQRGAIRFAPCNSQARRCIKCLEVGRRGSKANVVKDPATGRCEEHSLDGAGTSQGSSLLAQQRTARLAAFALRDVTTAPRGLGGPGFQKTVSNGSVHHDGAAKTSPTGASTVLDTVPATKNAQVPQERKPAPAPVQATKNAREVLEVDESIIAAGIASVKKLTPRELELFKHSTEGATNADLAARTRSTEGAVSVAMVDVFKKLGLGNVSRKTKRGILVQIRNRYVASRVVDDEPPRVAFGRFAGLDEAQVNNVIDEAEAALRSINGVRRESRND